MGLELGEIIKAHNKERVLMKIEQLDITEYTSAFPHDMGYLVFQIMGLDGGQYQVQYPAPDRGRDEELDFEDGQFPCLLRSAMLGKKITDEEALVGKFFRVQLPSGAFNG